MLKKSKILIITDCAPQSLYPGGFSSFFCHVGTQQNVSCLLPKREPSLQSNRVDPVILNLFPPESWEITSYYYKLVCLHCYLIAVQTKADTTQWAPEQKLRHKDCRQGQEQKRWRLRSMGPWVSVYRTLQSHALRELRSYTRSWPTAWVSTARGLHAESNRRISLILKLVGSFSKKQSAELETDKLTFNLTATCHTPVFGRMPSFNLQNYYE